MQGQRIDPKSSTLTPRARTRDRLTVL